MNADERRFRNDVARAIEGAIVAIRVFHGRDGWDLYQQSPEMRAVRAVLTEAHAALSADPVGKPQIVCLCGSGRFREAFEQAEYDETLAGRIVLTIGLNCHDVARSADLLQHKPMLDELHLRKIDLADEVLVLNVGGYIGDSTKREVAYAHQLGKVIRWLEPDQKWIIDDRRSSASSGG